MVRIGLVVLALCGFLIATSLFRLEFQAGTEMQQAQRGFVTALTSAEISGFSSAVSLRAQQDQMQACVDWQTNIMHDYYTSETKETLARACSLRAAEILVRSPTRSVALLAQAASHWHLSEPQQAADLLAQAQATGRYQGWMSIRRLRLALRIAFDDSTPPDVSDQALTIAEAELPILVSHSSLADLMVRLYQHEPRAREWFVGALETLTPEEQRLFLSRLRRAS